MMKEKCNCYGPIYCHGGSDSIQCCRKLSKVDLELFEERLTIIVQELNEEETEE